jgi:hypothetical protein
MSSWFSKYPKRTIGDLKFCLHPGSFLASAEKQKLFFPLLDSATEVCRLNKRKLLRRKAYRFI